ncbi:MAG: GT4 family glycosyltransferase PelF [Anaerotignum sp.]|nr:GT4 family glycosyltransferase PelF [Anaerotignum sp.]
MNVRVCLVLEGSYPYSCGGVSSWTHQYIQAFPEVEFVLWCICAKAEDKGAFKYIIPDNVVEIQEVFLGDALNLRTTRKRVRLKKEEMNELVKLLECKVLNWDVLFHLFHDKKMNPTSLLMSREFLDILIKICLEKYPYNSFSDMFHSERSMLLPELYIMTKEIPKADIYHAISTGYSGILASMGKWKYQKPLILTEHGIYTREREEEILRAKWVLPQFRQQWIDLFYVFSDCIYKNADIITALYERANDIQQELGCQKEKLRTIGNGIHYEKFSSIPVKKPDGFIDIGAIVRIAKIKDIKTMIYAFAELNERLPNVRLHILGGVDDEEYFEECKNLVKLLQIQNLYFKGIVDTVEYMQKLDFTILASISEGQPLSILESFAAQRPCVATDVGCCRELLEGTGDDQMGNAGICVSPMHKDDLAQAMYYLCTEEKVRIKMGKVAQQRVKLYYTHGSSMEKYRNLYQEVNQ